MITHFGMFIPLNLSKTWDKSPIPAPDSDDLFLVRRGAEWGIFWSISDEEEAAPEVMTSIAWLLDAAKRLGQAHISPYGYQCGEPVVCVLQRHAGSSVPNLGIISRFDWTAGTEVPGCP